MEQRRQIAYIGRQETLLECCEHTLLNLNHAHRPVVIAGPLVAVRRASNVVPCHDDIACTASAAFEQSGEEALRTAVAAGAASTLEIGAGRFDPRQAGQLVGAVEVSQLEPVAD